MKDKKQYIYLGVNLLIIAVWLLVFRHTFAATWRKFAIDLTFFGKGVLIFIIGTFIYRFIKSGSYKNFLSLPAGNVFLLAGLTAAAGFHIYNLHFVNINIVSVVLFVLGTYFLICLYFTGGWIKNSIIPLMLLISALPLSYYAEMIIGFPLRLWSAEAVTALLKSVNISTVTREAVIFMESRATKIDLSCSGMKGIWALSLFYFAAAWINSKKADLKLFLGFFAGIGIVILANLGRILIMTVTGTVFGREDFASFIHEPLGVAGFVFACAVSYFLFLRPGKEKPESPAAGQKSGGYAAPVYVIVLLAACLFLYSPKKPGIQAGINVEFDIKGSIKTEPIAFSDWEKSVFSFEDTPLAKKYRFTCKGMSGSMLIVQSRSWRAQHNPVFCLQGMGLKADNYGPFIIAPDFTAMLCSLDNNTKQATFWFQNKTGATDDYSKRIWSGIRDDKSKWVMVSVLFDKPYDVKSRDFVDFHRLIFDNVRETIR